MAELDIREYHDDDEPAVLELLQASLSWVPDDQHRAFFSWKHFENPFGRSPAWVAFEGRRIVGLRIFLRWDFERNGTVVRAVRAVDTATHPDFQGRGVFSRLTLHAIDELRAEGVGFVFNTPNDQSRPGYLKMGWKVVERLPVLARPRSPSSLLTVARARAPADIWSLPCTAGSSAPDVFNDRENVEELLRSIAPPREIATRRSAAFLAWRYGFAPLAYRVFFAGTGVRDGIVVFRLRRRGAAVEAAVCDTLMPDAQNQRARLARALRQVVRQSGADYAVRIGGRHVQRAGFLPLPGQGPNLVWRALSESVMPAAREWRLTLGDIELF